MDERGMVADNMGGLGVGGFVRTTSRTRTVIAMAAVIAVLVAVGAAVLTGIDADNKIDRATYLAANARVMKGVPIFPHAHLLRSAITARRADGAHLVGYMSTDVYALPPGTAAAEVTAFYGRRLPSVWKRQIYLRPNRYRGPILQYRDRDHQLQLVVRKSKPRIAISVDHNYYGAPDGSPVPRPE